MKRLLLFTVLFSPLFSIAQIGGGLSVGYSSKNLAVAEMSVGIKAAKRITVYPFTMKVHSNLSNPTVPIIYEPRVGFCALKNIEAYVGYGRHFAGQDTRKEFQQYAGWKAGAGLIYHIGDRVIISAAKSGSIYTLQIGLFRFMPHS